MVKKKLIREKDTNFQKEFFTVSSKKFLKKITRQSQFYANIKRKPFKKGKNLLLLLIIIAYF